MAGQPLLGYPVNEGDNIYLELGCGDVTSAYAANWIPPEQAVCPVHGMQGVNTYSCKAIIIDGTSAART